jgi:hypothetical protein
MPGMWGNGSWPWPAASGTARCAVLRPGHAAEMAGADLAVSRTAVLDDDFQRDPRCGVAPNGADNPRGCVGNQRAQLRRHHRLGSWPDIWVWIGTQPGTQSRSKPRPAPAAPIG